MSEHGAIASMATLERVKKERFRLTPLVYDAVLALRRQQQEGLCWLCHARVVEQNEWQLHHECNDSSCSDVTHFRAVHGSCNRSESARRKSRQVPSGSVLEREIVKAGAGEQGQNPTDETSLDIAKRVNPQIPIELDRILLESELVVNVNGLPFKGLLLPDVKYRLAKILDVSPQKMDNWLNTNTRAEGDYMVVPRTFDIASAYEQTMVRTNYARVPRVFKVLVKTASAPSVPSGPGF